jgi:hypothetical protein
VWLSSWGMGCSANVFYGRLQNLFLVKLLMQVLDLIGSLDERFE